MALFDYRGILSLTLYPLASAFTPSYNYSQASYPIRNSHDADGAGYLEQGAGGVPEAHDLAASPGGCSSRIRLHHGSRPGALSALLNFLVIHFSVRLHDAGGQLPLQLLPIRLPMLHRSLFPSW